MSILDTLEFQLNQYMCSLLYSMFHDCSKGWLEKEKNTYQYIHVTHITITAVSVDQWNSTAFTLGHTYMYGWCLCFQCIVELLIEIHSKCQVSQVWHETQCFYKVMWWAFCVIQENTKVESLDLHCLWIYLSITSIHAFVLFTIFWLYSNIFSQIPLIT